MPTRSHSESEHDLDGETTAHAEVGASVQGSGGGQPQSVGALAGFRLPLPGMGDVDPLRLLWLGGLAALATIEIIEWPVALAVGVGSVVTERLARQDVRKDLTAHS
ncbi:MAG: hypothetical protein WCF33_02400 [Pseudonocardiaceae bacterium]